MILAFRRRVCLEMGALLVLVALCAPAVGKVGPDPALPLPERLFPQLEPILADALRQSPSMIDRNLDLLQAEELRAVSSARQFPDAGGSFQFNVQRDDRANLQDTVTSQKLRYSAAVTQPIFHWGALRAGAEIGRIRARIAASNMAEAYRLLALSIRSSFLRLIIGKADLDAAEFDLGLAKKRLDIAAVRVAAGEAPARVKGAAEGAVSEAQLDLDKTRFNLDVATREFRRLTGKSSFEVSMIPSEIPSLKPPAEASTHPFRINFVEKEGFADTQKYQKALLDLSSEQQSERILHSTLRPNLDAVAGVYQDELSYTLDVSRRDRIKSLYIGVRVSWNIFDSFATRGRVRASKIEQRQLKNRLKELETDLVNAARDAETELGFAGRSLDFAEKRFAASQAVLAIAKDDFQKGRTSEIDVGAAQSSAMSATTAVFRARASYLDSLAKYLSTVNADPVVLDAMDEIVKR